MKRFLMVIALCVMTFWGAYTSEARGFGITGGASFVSIKDVSVEKTTGYHAGITYKFDLPLGFAIQPSVLYHMKGSVVKDAYENGSSLDLKTGYVEVPVSFQWGPDLLLFRPFLDVSPYVGYALSSKVSPDALLTQKEWKSDYLQRFEYGIGLGGGIEIWRFQILCRYNWNFGSLFNTQYESYLAYVEQAMANKNFGGVTLSLAFLFGK